MPPDQNTRLHSSRYRKNMKFYFVVVVVAVVFDSSWAAGAVSNSANIEASSHAAALLSAASFAPKDPQRGTRVISFGFIQRLASASWPETPQKSRLIRQPRHSYKTEYG